jgi:hypothetical protein
MALKRLLLRRGLCRFGALQPLHQQRQAIPESFGVEAPRIVVPIANASVDRGVIGGN